MYDDRQHTGIIMIQLDSKVNFLMRCRRLKTMSRLNMNVKGDHDYD